MKKSLLFLVFFTNMLTAYYLDNCDIKVRGVAFIPRSSLFRNIYGKALGAIELEVDTVLRDTLNFWANFDWLFNKNGRSLGLCDPTKLHMGSFSFGLKYFFDFCSCWEGYLGLGPTFGKVNIQNLSSCSGCEKIDCWVSGLVAKTGVQYTYRDCYYLDLFADYVYQPTHFQTCVDVGGLRLGLGLGRRF